MQGRIIEFSAQHSSGSIAGDDGYRYNFSASEWRSDHPPAQDQVVQFTSDEQGVNAYSVQPAGGVGGGNGSNMGQSSGGGASGQRPPLPDNYLIWSIVATVLCCLPTGIVAIVKAAKVNGLHANGQHLEAQEAAKSAKKWCWISVGLGLAAMVVFTAMGLLGGGLSV